MRCGSIILHLYFIVINVAKNFYLKDTEKVSNKYVRGIKDMEGNKNLCATEMCIHTYLTF